MPVVGWREWVRLGPPERAPVTPLLKVKVDTGARSSALHVVSMEPVELEAGPGLRFLIHPHQASRSDALWLAAPLVDRRSVRSSSGQETLRPVVHLGIRLGTHAFPAEVTLTRRDRMRFRMLLGRTALRDRFLVDPARSWLQSEPSSPPDPRAPVP
ncbi:MAG: hypothetical protein EA352_06535 [Gemmatimonadales bacterium]|nr:MAG: hypothetical protein EA352_06535 [Gemmatimonadales bacterium]